MRIQDLWNSQSAVAVLGRVVLTPASWLYSFGWECYSFTYKLGLKKASEPFKPVVCIGNLTVGGTGKTPITLAIARQLVAGGKPVVLSLSGYGSPRSESASVAPEGPLNAVDWGDEPALVRSLLPEIPMIIGRNRVTAAKLAAAHFPGFVLLLDDGFQHLPLKKHVTILLDDSSPKNKQCLPAGPYREPRRNRVNADLILGEKFKLVRSRLRFEDTTMGPIDPPVKASMLCAIGNPDAFAQSLRDVPVELAETRAMPDHDQLTAGNLFDGLDCSVPIVVTSKDWVKLKGRSDLSGWQILIAQQDVEIEPQAEFINWLIHQLSAVRAR
jgi:tetraacyldisaccharide 4'-kinase